MGVALASATLILCLWVVWDQARGTRSMGHLREFAPAGDESWPRVSVCFAARDEAGGVEQAVRSLLALDYPDLEVVGVDDRSTDGTGDILDRLARGDPRLRVAHVTELPPGWLGKNHGLQRAAERASGEWLLFTDADVVLAPGALKHAVTAARRSGADHLAVGPEVEVSSWPLGVAVSVFLLLFGVYCRPWAAGRPGPWHIGIGAFNFVCAAAYRAIDGHRDLRLRPDDDMKLGKRLKLGGFKTLALFGQGLVRVEWYRTVGELVRGLKKNIFAGFEYHLTLVIAALAVQFLVFLWPFLAVWGARGLAQLCYAGCVLSLLWLHGEQAEHQGRPRAYALAFPLGIALFLFIVANATWATLRTGGIEWRGTHYPLDQLRTNRVGGWLL